MSKERKSHTPGPWSYRQCRNKTRGIWIDCDASDERGKMLGGTLAEAYEHGCGDGDQEANARLIAASPDLLAACKEITRVLNAIGWANVASDWPVVTDACELARAAIAKAEGK